MARQLAGCMGTSRQAVKQPGNRSDQSSRDSLMLNYGIRYECTTRFSPPAPVPWQPTAALQRPNVVTFPVTPSATFHPAPGPRFQPPPQPSPDLYSPAPNRPAAVLLPPRGHRRASSFAMRLHAASHSSPAASLSAVSVPALPGIPGCLRYRSYPRSEHTADSELNRHPRSPAQITPAFERGRVVLRW